MNATTRPIYIVNPNSSAAVTEGIDRALEPIRRVSPFPLLCRTLAQGPAGIQSQRDVDGVIGPLLQHCAELEADAGAFVVACFSDPGLAALREQSARPVLGIAESAVLTALQLGQRFGVLSILRTSIPRHLRYFGAMGVLDRLAADLPLGLGVAELADAQTTFERLAEVGTRLRDDHGADTLILGCAGMAGQREALQNHLSIPVVEPCQAAAAMALGHLALGWQAVTRHPL